MEIKTTEDVLSKDFENLLSYYSSGHRLLYYSDSETEFYIKISLETGHIYTFHKNIKNNSEDKEIKTTLTPKDIKILIITYFNSRSYYDKTIVLDEYFSWRKKYLLQKILDSSK